MMVVITITNKRNNRIDDAIRHENTDNKHNHDNDINNCYNINNGNDKDNDKKYNNNIRVSSEIVDAEVQKACKKQTSEKSIIPHRDSQEIKRPILFYFFPVAACLPNYLSSFPIKLRHKRSKKEKELKV